MDSTVAIFLVLFFASISIVGALRRIRDATERAVELLEAQVSRERAKD